MNKKHQINADKWKSIVNDLQKYGNYNLNKEKTWMTTALKSHIIKHTEIIDCKCECRVK